MNDLEKARGVINQIDAMMIELFKVRMKAVKVILEYKKENNLEIFDEARELELLNKNLELLNDQELEQYYKTFFKAVLKSSKDYQGSLYE